MTHPSDPRCLTKTNKNVYTYKDYTHIHVSFICNNQNWKNSNAYQQMKG